MSKTRIVLSFDDGRADNLRAVKEIITPCGLKATMNITTNFVEDTIPSDVRPCPNVSMDRVDVAELASFANIEIAGHGTNHQNTLEDLGEGVKTLRRWLPDTPIVGIASPNSKLLEEDIIKDQAAYEALGLSYVRIGPGNSYSGLHRIFGKLARMTGSSWFYTHSVAGALITGKPGFCLLSVPVMKPHRLQQVQALVRSAVQKDADLILMFHSILKPDEDHYADDWTWDYEDFNNLCQWLSNQGDIEVVTTAELVSAGK